MCVYIYTIYIYIAHQTVNTMQFKRSIPFFDIKDGFAFLKTRRMLTRRPAARTQILHETISQCKVAVLYASATLYIAAYRHVCVLEIIIDITRRLMKMKLNFHQFSPIVVLIHLMKIES